MITDDPIRDLERQLVGAVVRAAGPHRRSARHQTRRWVRALPAGGVLAGVVIGLVAWLGGGTSAPSAAQAAYTRLNPEDGIVDLRYDTRFYDGGRLYQHSRAEVWYSATRERSVATSVGPRSGRAGRFLEVARSAHQIRSYESGADTITIQANCRVARSGTVDPIASFRSLYQRHRISQRGMTTFDGRRVSRLVADEAGQQFVYLVTPGRGEPVAMTVRPLALATPAARFTGTVVRFLSYRRLPMNVASRMQLEMTSHRGAKVIELGRSRCPQR